VDRKGAQEMFPSHIPAGVVVRGGSRQSDLDGEARGTIEVVVGCVCVVIGKVEVGWDVGGGLGSKVD